MPFSLWIQQLESSHNKLQKKIEELSSVVNAAEDKVFSHFCHKIKVKHIREYEERQLKASQDESEARLRFDTQIARLTHQWVHCFHTRSIHLSWCHFFRTNFEEDSLQTIKERIATLAATSNEHAVALTKLEASKATAQAEIDEAQSGIEALQEELKQFQEDLEEKTSALDDVKRVASKASKTLDKALKDIAARVCLNFQPPCGMLIHCQNDDIEKLASERSGIYRKCRLEEIALPLNQGNLKDVAMDEVCPKAAYHIRNRPTV